MSDNKHPTEPSPEQFTEWLAEAVKGGVAGKVGLVCDKIAHLAYAAGADAQLDACCEWLKTQLYLHSEADKLRAARRPKPPSLKEQALEALAKSSQLDGYRCLNMAGEDAIRRAIEALPEDAQ